MPTNPASIFVPPIGGGPPTAPGNVFVPPIGGGPPTSPGNVFVPPAGGLPPTAPGPVFSLPETGDGLLTISGTLVPALNGTLREVHGEVSSAIVMTWCGARMWSTDGSGFYNALINPWVAIHGEYLVTPAVATINAIFPPEQYTPRVVADMNDYTFGSAPFGTEIRFDGPVFYGTYTLVKFGNEAAKWCVLAPFTGADAGATSVAAGTLICGNNRTYETTFMGGLGAAWAADPAALWRWREMAKPSTGNNSKAWRGSTYAHTPQAAGPWTAINGLATGTFTLSAAGGGAVGNPPSVFNP